MNTIDFSHFERVEILTRMYEPVREQPSCCQAIEAWDHRDRLGSITPPTLVIAGSADPSTPVEPHARTIVDGIPGARLEVLEGAHLATIERADEATKLISENAGR